MKNYTIELYGWTLDAKAKSLNLEQVDQINTLKNDVGAQDLSQIKLDIEDTVVSDDTWDILRVSKPFWYLDKTIFVVKDDQNIEVNRFELSSVIHHEEFGTLETGVDFVIIPGVEFDHILFSVDELKGGICSYKTTSKEVPQVSDFSVLDGSIEGPYSEWEFIDSLFFKGNKLEITSYLDSDCKSSEVVIYSN
tara:strand:+ start:50 stop:628 length:579 start_codon:yes stop_codon:yes gene_type:complete